MSRGGRDNVWRAVYTVGQRVLRYPNFPCNDFFVRGGTRGGVRRGVSCAFATAVPRHCDGLSKEEAAEP
jgi:hypothetical protein